MVTTRGRKRKIGQRDSLWDVIVNNDDICFKHILPRLNGTDLKFLHGVNSETRKLIKRSSRKKELKERFKVNEMSSISTLEVAWEHYPWGKLVRQYGPRMDEPYFCEKVARTNKLELLKWAREEKKCEWDGRTINTAAYHGNREMVSIALQMSVVLMSMRVHGLPETVISSASNTYAKKSKRLGIMILPIWRLEMVISTYSNILLSVSLINITKVRVRWQPGTAN